MDITSSKSKLSGKISIPSSKSHTIRALVISTLSSGISCIKNPLQSLDTISCKNACSKLGATITEIDGQWQVQGIGSTFKSQNKTIDIGNSGTSLRLLTAAAALGNSEIIFSGDESTQKRPMEPLITSINDLGANAKSVNGNNCAPISISGPLKGGTTEIECVTSQYLSALLIALPLARGDSLIAVKKLNEKPYIDITLKWLNEMGIECKNNNYETFEIKGNQQYKPFTKQIPGDFSSMAFPLLAAAITNSQITISGLDMTDIQGDKVIIDYFKKMGADIDITGNDITISGASLKGIEIDLNSAPDALPALAVAGCFAEGKTVLKNVGQARLKETDRIKVMTENLIAIGAKVEAFADGMTIYKSTLCSNSVKGYFDHRVVMAMAVAGLTLEKGLSVDSAESTEITFPDFVKKFSALGANITLNE